jgi:hypothetical protein
MQTRGLNISFKKSNTSLQPSISGEAKFQKLKLIEDTLFTTPVIFRSKGRDTYSMPVADVTEVKEFKTTSENGKPE